MDMIAKKIKKSSVPILLIFLIIHYGNSKNVEVCNTEACKISASNMKKYMNTSVKPCDNFYEFVCGNFKNEVIIKDGYLANSSTYMTFDKVQQQLKTSFESEFSSEKDPEAFLKLKSYYDLCMDDEKREKNSETEFLEIVKQVGGWPLIMNGPWNDSDFDWMETTEKLNKKGFIPGAFFNLHISTDVANNSRRVIYLENPEFCSVKNLFFKVQQSKITTIYLKFMVDVAVILGADKDRATQELNDVLQFKMNLAKNCLTPAEQMNISNPNLYNPMSIAELQRKYPHIPWLNYIKNLFSPYQTVNHTDTIIITARKYFENLSNIVSSTPKRVQANFLFWEAFLQVRSMMSERIKKASELLRRAMVGTDTKASKSLRCVIWSSERFSLATGALYVRKYFDHSKKESVLKIVNDVNDTFKNILNHVDWMDIETKKAALKKLNNMAPLIAYPDELLDDKKLNEYYKDLKIDSNSLLKTELKINSFRFNSSLKSFREPVNRFDWTGIFGAASTVNAFYHATSNAIVFPSGILQQPIFNADNPMYMNYAGLGSIVGHEMTHGFDHVGRQFDEKGHFLDWWKSETKKNFMKKAQCIIQQYSNYTVKEIDEKLNGLTLKRENVADNGGMKISYMAYNKWQNSNSEEPRLPGFESYNPRQLFWISLAHVWCTKHRPETLKMVIQIDPHTIASYRTIGALSNRPEFSNDFNCPSGSLMNPHQKCQVW